MLKALIYERRKKNNIKTHKRESHTHTPKHYNICTIEQFYRIPVAHTATPNHMNHIHTTHSYTLNHSWSRTFVLILFVRSLCRLLLTMFRVKEKHTYILLLLLVLFVGIAFLLLRLTAPLSAQNAYQFGRNDRSICVFVQMV